MKTNYKQHSEITKEILDTIQVGNLVKCNDWKKPLRVIAVSKNYFVMCVNQFGKSVYSVCEKKLSQHTRNNFTKGNFRIGTDNMLFGAGRNYFDENEMNSYLQEFEIGNIELSERRAINLISISVGV